MREDCPDSRSSASLPPPFSAVDAPVVDKGGSAAQRASNATPWALAVRWWWLKGIRERHAGRREEALACFRRCIRVLRSKGKKHGERDRLKEADDGDDRDEDEEKEGSEEAVVLLPYCVVHPRIDTHVSLNLVKPAIYFGMYLCSGSVRAVVWGCNVTAVVVVFLAVAVLSRLFSLLRISAL